MGERKELIKKGINSLRRKGLKSTYISFRRWIMKPKDRAENLICKNDEDAMEEYIDYIESVQKANFTKNSELFIPISKTDHQRTDNETKLIAFYLPQYYQMEVNNKYHGQGFTEWTNVTQAMPQFTGHYQPHIPYDVGFYDLTTVSALKRQAELAKKYGIYGFCMHWYWFSGERTMEVPPQILLQHPEIDIKYCFDWATENWTSAWDGGTKDIIFEQKLEEGDEKRFIEDLLPYFKDERYIKINGKPVLTIYRCDMFPKERFVKAVTKMRELVKGEGFPDLYLMLTNRVFEGNAKEWGFDALVEFPPSYIYPLCKRYHYEGYINPDLKADIFDIKPFVESGEYIRKYDSDVVFRSALVSFDNTSRRATSGCQIIANDSPEVYEKWLTGLIEDSYANHTTDENIVFINSWNEWAEGSHLEPDMKYGYAYLQATRDALEKTRGIKTDIVEKKIESKKKEGITPIKIYIHCIESMGDIVASEPVIRYLKNKYSDIKIVWMVKKPFRDVVAYNSYIDEIIEVSCLGESMDLLKKISKGKENVIVDLHFDGRGCSTTKRYHSNLNNPMVNEKTYLNYGSLLANFCLSAGLPPIDDAPRFYLNPEMKLPDNLPKEYVVFHCKSAESTKDWDDNKWNVLAHDLMEIGISIVEIGLKPVVRNRSRLYYDMTNNHDLQQIALIIKNANCFFGVDSGFAHFANCFGVYGILIFGKYKNFSKPMMYSGKYADGSNATIIYAENDAPAKEVEEKLVYNTYQKVFGLVDDNNIKSSIGNNSIQEQQTIIENDVILLSEDDFKNQLSDYTPFTKPNVDMGGTYGNITYSQFGDDLVIINLFNIIGISKPSYLDIGAHHPYVMSNTALLYDMGARGINIEADKNLILAFIAERPEDKNINATIDSETRKACFYHIEKAPGCSTLVKRRADGFINEFPQYAPIDEQNVNTVTIDKIVSQYCEGIYPDFLNLNVGGNEYEILSSSDLIYSNGPSIVDVEIDKDQHEELEKMMQENGYFFFIRLGVNDIYIRDKYKENFGKE